jgi:hypothetical protein
MLTHKFLVCKYISRSLAFFSISGTNALFSDFHYISTSAATCSIVPLPLNGPIYTLVVSFLFITHGPMTPVLDFLCEPLIHSLWHGLTDYRALMEKPFLGHPTKYCIQFMALFGQSKTMQKLWIQAEVNMVQELDLNRLYLFPRPRHFLLLIFLKYPTHSDIMVERPTNNLLSETDHVDGINKKTDLIQ